MSAVIKWGVALDPGKHRAGVAVFRDSVLWWAGLCGDGKSGPLSTVRATVAALTLGAQPSPFFSWAIVENQQVYRGLPGPNPNDLIPLAFVAGGVTASISSAADCAFRFPLPREWKGSVPKKVWTARILSRLSTAELDILKAVKCPASLRHNTVDAIGLGLWHLGRL